MDPRIEIWNILHDGEIAGIEGILPGDVGLRIYIPYLTKMFAGEDEDILLTLKRCTRLSMKIWDEDLVTDEFDQIVGTGTEILSTKSTGFPVHIVTTKGELDLEFTSVTFALGNGREISFDDLDNAAKRYWSDLDKKSKGA